MLLTAVRAAGTTGAGGAEGAEPVTEGLTGGRGDALTTLIEPVDEPELNSEPKILPNPPLEDLVAGEDDVALVELALSVWSVPEADTACG